MFNSIHHKEPWRFDCTKRKRRGVWKGESMGAVKKTNKKRTEVEAIKNVAQPPEHILMTY